MSNSRQDLSDSVELVQACVDERPFAWQRFVDQNLGTVIQVIDQINDSTSLKLSRSDRESAARLVFETMRADDCALLRRYREYANFETFLVLMTRRIMKKSASESEEET